MISGAGTGAEEEPGSPCGPSTLPSRLAAGPPRGPGVAAGAGRRGQGAHFTFLRTDGLIARDPAEGSVRVSHTQSLCGALQPEPVFTVKLGDRTFREGASAGRPEAVLGDAWVRACLKVIEPYIDREKKRCL